MLRPAASDCERNLRLRELLCEDDGCEGDAPDVEPIPVFAGLSAACVAETALGIVDCGLITIAGEVDLLCEFPFAVALCTCLLLPISVVFIISTGDDVALFNVSAILWAVPCESRRGGLIGSSNSESREFFVSIVQRALPSFMTSPVSSVSVFMVVPSRKCRADAFVRFEKLVVVLTEKMPVSFGVRESTCLHKLSVVVGT